MVECSKEMEKYFEDLETGCQKVYKVALEARKKGYDPKEAPEVILAKNMAESVDIGVLSLKHVPVCSIPLLWRVHTTGTTAGVTYYLGGRYRGICGVGVGTQIQCCKS